MKKINISLLFTLLGLVGIYAQDFNSDILRINQVYSGVKRISMKTRYTVYRNHEGKDLISLEDGFIKSDSLNQYIKIGPVETLSTPSLFIMVNHSDKIILLDKPGENKESTPVDLTFELENMIKKGTQPVFTKITSTIGQYTVQIKDGEFERIHFRYGLKDFMLYGLDLYYRRTQDLEGSPTMAGKPLLTIEYSDVDKHPRFSKDTFSVDKFIAKNAHSYQPSLKYQDYEIIDQTQY